MPIDLSCSWSTMAAFERNEYSDQDVIVVVEAIGIAGGGQQGLGAFDVGRCRLDLKRGPEARREDRRNRRAVAEYAGLDHRRAVDHHGDRLANLGMLNGSRVRLKPRKRMLVLRIASHLEIFVGAERINIAKRCVLDVIGRTLNDQTCAGRVLGGDGHFERIEVRQAGRPNSDRVCKSVSDVFGMYSSSLNGPVPLVTWVTSLLLASTNAFE